MIAKLKVLIFILTYNAEKTIKSVLDRIPKELAESYNVHILVIDDCSQDNTWLLAKEHLASFWCSSEVLRNPVNQGYGGNQKIGYHYAFEKDYDIVAMVHGDGQYAPECLPELLLPFASNNSKVDAVFGSRMLCKKDAIKGGMPYYKFIGNIVLTYFQNIMLQSNLAEFHTGYRVYRVKALGDIPFLFNTNDFHFDTEIIVQLLFAGKKIIELPIPTFYGEEVCHVNGFRYAYDVFKATIKARLVRMGIFYDPKFYFEATVNRNKVDKLSFESMCKYIVQTVPVGSCVLDLGRPKSLIATTLAKDKLCTVYNLCATDVNIAQPDKKEMDNIPWDKIEYIIIVNIFEQLPEPELFLEWLRQKLANYNIKIIVSSGNVGFFITRLMLLLGQFNYSKRGLLDLHNKRLFTIGSLCRIFRYAGYSITQKKHIAAPYPLAIGLNIFSRSLFKINSLLIKILPGLFSYQVVLEVQHYANVERLLNEAEK